MNTWFYVFACYFKLIFVNATVSLPSLGACPLLWCEKQTATMSLLITHNQMFTCSLPFRKMYPWLRLRRKLAAKSHLRNTTSICCGVRWYLIVAFFVVVVFKHVFIDFYKVKVIGELDKSYSSGKE